MAPLDPTANRSDYDTDSSVDRKIRAGIRSYARRSLAGFMILLVGVGIAINVSVYTGCEGRQDTAQTLDGLLERLNDSNRLQYEKGRYTLAERTEAKAFYEGERKRLTVPTCKLF